MNRFAEISEDDFVLRFVVADSIEQCVEDLGGTWTPVEHLDAAPAHTMEQDVEGNWQTRRWDWENQPVWNDTQGRLVFHNVETSVVEP